MKGAYVLIINLKKDSTIQVGKLGKINFKKGIYAYVGSGMNNLEKRIERHFRLAKNKKGNVRWHIDYLLVNPDVRVVDVIPIESDRKIECEISQLLEKKALRTIPGFGSTDCKKGCKAGKNFSAEVCVGFG